MFQFLFGLFSGIYIGTSELSNFADIGLEYNTEYCYTVSAYNDIGVESEQSNEAWYLFEQTLEEQKSVEKYQNRLQYTFALGVVPEEIRQAASNLATEFARLTYGFNEIKECKGTFFQVEPYNDICMFENK